MKILQVYPYFYPAWSYGGVTRVAYEISRRLADRGHEVTIYATDALDNKSRVTKNTNPTYIDGMKVYYFKNLSNYLTYKHHIPLPLGMPFRIKEEVKKFDVIHLHGYPHSLNVLVHYYAKKYGVPYVLQAHGAVLPFFQKQRLKKIFDIFFGYKMLRDASKVIASTKIEAGQYKKMDVDEDKIEIVPNGIDLSEYDNLPERGEFRRKYSIRDDEKIILYLGRIHKIKGIDLLVDAFAELIKVMDNVKLAIVGPDDGFLSTIKKQIEDLKVGDKILLTGRIPEKDKLGAYVDADVYVLPSVYETFPISVLEACACGTPIIVTDRCGIANIVNNNVGYVVKYNKNPLQDTIFKILTNVELRRYFGEGGKKLVREKFSWDIVVEQLEKIYGDVKG
ncbi:MAG: glycosyltransferase [Methanophagales archaeon]|nr:glycosyltransferase [Methanophagales archaeon]